MRPQLLLPYIPSYSMRPVRPNSRFFIHVATRLLLFVLRTFRSTAASFGCSFSSFRLWFSSTFISFVTTLSGFIIGFVFAFCSNSCFPFGRNFTIFIGFVYINCRFIISDITTLRIFGSNSRSFCTN